MAKSELKKIKGLHSVPGKDWDAEDSEGNKYVYRPYPMIWDGRPKEKSKETSTTKSDMELARPNSTKLYEMMDNELVSEADVDEMALKYNGYDEIKSAMEVLGYDTSEYTDIDSIYDDGNLDELDLQKIGDELLVEMSDDDVGDMMRLNGLDYEEEEELESGPQELMDKFLDENPNFASGDYDEEEYDELAEELGYSRDKLKEKLLSGDTSVEDGVSLISPGIAMQMLANGARNIDEEKGKYYEENDDGSVFVKKEDIPNNINEKVIKQEKQENKNLYDTEFEKNHIMEPDEFLKSPEANDYEEFKKFVGIDEGIENTKEIYQPKDAYKSYYDKFIQHNDNDTWTGKEYTNDEFMEHLTDANWHTERQMLEDARLTNEELSYIKDKVNLSKWSAELDKNSTQELINEAKNKFRRNKTDKHPYVIELAKFMNDRENDLSTEEWNSLYKALEVLRKRNKS